MSDAHATPDQTTQPESPAPTGRGRFWWCVLIDRLAYGSAAMLLAGLLFVAVDSLSLGEGVEQVAVVVFLCLALSLVEWPCRKSFTAALTSFAVAAPAAGVALVVLPAVAGSTMGPAGAFMAALVGASLGAGLAEWRAGRRLAMGGAVTLVAVISSAGTMLAMFWTRGELLPLCGTALHGGVGLALVVGYRLTGAAPAVRWRYTMASIMVFQMLLATALGTASQYRVGRAMRQSEVAAFDAMGERVKTHLAGRDPAKDPLDPGVLDLATWACCFNLPVSRLEEYLGKAQEWPASSTTPGGTGWHFKTGQDVQMIRLTVGLFDGHIMRAVASGPRTFFMDYYELKRRRDSLLLTLLLAAVPLALAAARLTAWAQLRRVPAMTPSDEEAK